MKRSDLRGVYLNAGMSRREFARQINVPEQSLRRFEDGDGISPANAKRLADYLGCKVTDLLDGNDAPVAA
jgi:ribosome-binding protein aMBF1 (putative translation factor)